MAARGGLFFYDRQDEWRPAVCTTGTRQSPINITTANVQENSDLIALGLSDSWGSPYEGRFFNDDGSTAILVPSSPTERPTFTSHAGRYSLQNVHFHWGGTNQVGSEHLVDGNSGQLEVHFVHFREGSSGPAENGHFGVVSVLANVDENAGIDGVWERLNVMMIQDLDGSTMIRGFRFDWLLPPEQNRDYYFYEGSLTTPACTETANWFVMKERITVPAAYLEQLRQLQEEAEPLRLLTRNFRDVQDINNRVVSTPSSQATFKQPVLSLLVIFCMMAAVKLF